MKKIIFILVLFAFTTFSVDLLSYPWGISGRTKKTYSSGCSTCHYFGAAYVNAVFNSPDTVVMGQTYLFSITITKTNTGNGGIDIASKRGTLDTMGSPYLKLSNTELIHKDRISIPSGTITINFTYTAPNTVGFDTLYATASVGYNGNWNWAPNKRIAVISSAPPPPVLISPSNGSVISILTPELSWNPFSNVLRYHLEISQLPNFGIITDSGNVYSPPYFVAPNKLTNLTTYFWRVKAQNSIGYGLWSDVWSFTCFTNDVRKISSLIPYKTELYNNYPNPFNSSTVIKYSIRKSDNVKLILYDITGKEINILVNGFQTAGIYSVQFNFPELSSGVYYCKLFTDNFSDVKKIILIR